VPVYLPPEPIVAQVLVPMRTFLRRLVQVTYPPGTILTSWWRSIGENARVGGNPRSQHLAGLAWDLAAPNPAVLAAQLRHAGLVVVVEADHVHVQALPAEASPVARLLLV
jgi:hypothetical protein